MLIGFKSKEKPKQKLEQLTKSETQKDRSSQKKKVTCWVENSKEQLRKKLGLNKFFIRLKTCKHSLDEAQAKENKETEQLKPNEWVKFLETGANNVLKP